MSNEWKMVRLGDCATFINGKAFKPTEWTDSGLPIIRIQNLTKSNKEINYFRGDIDDKYKIKSGEILISWSASLGVFIWNKGSAVLNQHIFKVVFDKFEFNKKYFYYLMQDTLDAMSLQTHGSTMKHITKGNFDNMKVLYIPINKQQEIAGLLDKASELVEKHKVQLDLLDLLAESVFYDMFGDPAINTKRWIVEKLVNVATKIFAGGDAPANQSSELSKDFNIPIFANAKKNNGLYGYTNIAKVNDASLTIAARGSGTGFVAERYESFYPIVRLIVVIPNVNKITMKYLYYVINILGVERNGCAIPQLTIPMMADYQMPSKKSLKRE